MRAEGEDVLAHLNERNLDHHAPDVVSHQNLY